MPQGAGVAHQAQNQITPSQKTEGGETSASSLPPALSRERRLGRSEKGLGRPTEEVEVGAVDGEVEVGAVDGEEVGAAKYAILSNELIFYFLPRWS